MQPFEKKFREWLTWYSYHRTNISNAPIERRVDFLEKSVRGLMECMALAVDTTNQIRGQNEVHIDLPSRIVLTKDLRTGGHIAAR